MFSCETEVGGGAREFFLASATEMAKHLQMISADRRCWYELIEERKPVRVYLDVEFSKSLNPHLDGSQMMRELLQLLIQFLSLNFPSLSQAEISFVVDLESVYAEKFSRHIVFPKVVVEDSAQVWNHFLFAVSHLCIFKLGALMLQFREYLELRFDSVPGARCCFVQTDKTDRAFVCDLSVYSKNRNFRMPFCTKRGKDAPLIPISGSNGSEFDLHVFNGDERKAQEKK